MKSELRKLFKASSQVYGGQVIGIAISMVLMIMVARELGPEGRGVYTWVMTLAVIGANIALFGMDSLNRRIAAQNKELIPQLIGNTLALTLFTLVLMVPLLVWVGGQFAIGSANFGALVVALLSVPLNVGGQVLVGILLPLHRNKSVAAIQIVTKLITLIGFLLLFMLDKVSVVSVLAVTALGTTAALIIPLYSLRDYLQKGVSFSLNLMKGMWKYSSGAFIATVCYYLLTKMNLLMLGVMSGEKAIGFYGLAVAMMDVMILLPSTIGYIMLSHIAAIEEQQNRRIFRRKIMLTMAGFMGISCVIAAWLAPYIIPWVFGADFTATITPFQILMPGAFFLSIYLIAQNSLSATGRARHIFPAALIGLGINIYLSWLWIPEWSIHGAALASTVSYAVTMVVALVLDRK